MYGESTVTFAQNAKTLFFRGCIAVVSVLFALLLAQDASFRNEIVSRLRLLWKHPLVKIISALYAILIVSTIFSFHPVIGFLGDVEREEGLLGLTFFYSVFLYTVLLFKQKDWYTYFGCLMSTQVIVFGSALIQLSQGQHRTNGILGNPIYFAVYALCMFAISSIAWMYAKKSSLPVAKFFSMVSIFIAVVELFLGNTRAVLLGVVVAIAVSFVYIAVNPETVFPIIAKKKIRTTAGIIFASFLIFAGIFLSTRHAYIWSRIPGLDRISASTVDDSTTKSRIASWSIALHSINPAEAGIGRMLIGYGWDNYFFAWQKFYQPVLYQYDTATFDHPHNKLLDMLVMNGVIGLALYLLFWYLFIRTLIRYSKREGFVATIFIFWSVAYFIQNLFAFDTIVSWILSFIIFAFVINETLYEYEK